MKRLLVTVFGIALAAVLLFVFAYMRTSETKYEDSVALPFDDILEGDWYYQYISTVYHHGWFYGTSQETFSPNDPLTRGGFAQVLYRYLDQPELRGYENPFEDLANVDCKHAVIYLNKLGIFEGKDKTHFAPDAPITREELVTILYRLGGYKVHEEFSPSGKFMDWERVNLWARDAVDWAIHCDILSGMSSTLLAPQQPATRAQAAKMLCVYAEKAGYKTDTSDPNRSVVLQVWQAGVDDFKQAETMKKLMNSFEKKNPGVIIEYTPIPSGDEPYKQITQAFKKGSAPDVLIVGSPYEMALADSGYIQALDTLLSRPVVEDIQAGLLLDSYYDRDENPELRSRLVSVPLSASPRALLINKELFDHFKVSYPGNGYSYEKLLLDARCLTDQKDGKVVFGYGSRASSPALYLGMLWSRNLSVVDPVSMKASTSGKVWEEVSSVYRDLYSNEFTPDYQVAMDYYSVLNMFGGGTIAMIDASLGVANVLRSKQDWEDKLLVYPYLDTDQKAALCVGEVAVLSSTTKHAIDGAELINFLLSADSQVFYAKKTGGIPAVMSALDLEELSEDPYLAPYVFGLEDTMRMGTQAHEIYATLRDELCTFIKGEEDTTEYCTALKEKINLLLAQKE